VQLPIKMHYVSLVKNRTVQVNFGLKPNFGFNFSLKLYLRGNFSFKVSLKIKLKSNALSLYIFILIRFYTEVWF